MVKVRKNEESVCLLYTVDYVENKECVWRTLGDKNRQLSRYWESFER